IAALMVLGIAAFNVVTLQTAEDDRERTQTAVRMALGAPPWALHAQRLGRYAFVALLGSLAGVLCGHALVRVLARQAPGEAWLDPGSGALAIPARSAAAVVLACGVSTLVAAAFVWSPIRRSLLGDLRSGDLSIPRAHATWVSRWMLVFEVTLA